MSNSRKQERSTAPHWETAPERIKWLVETRFNGNRSAMAKVIGFSHAIVGRVVAGAQPGRRLLEAVVKQLHVNAAWLERGEGQPFSHDQVHENRGIPLTNVLLPGPPSAHQDMITGGWATLPEIVASPSVYWLALQSTQPVVKMSTSGFRAGDHLLMETDPAKFPKEDRLWEHLCVVRDGADGSQLKLAKVDYYEAGMDTGDARLEADFFVPTHPDQTIVEDVYRRLPDGEVQHFQRSFTQAPKRAAMLVTEPLLPVIRYTDIVSVWLKILRRPLG